MPSTSDLREPAKGNSIDSLAGADGFTLLTVDEVAAWLKVSKSWVYEHTRVRGTRGAALPFVKIGKYVRFDPRDLQAYIDDKRELTRVALHAR